MEETLMVEMEKPVRSTVHSNPALEKIEIQIA